MDFSYKILLYSTEKMDFSILTHDECIQIIRSNTYCEDDDYVESLYKRYILETDNIDNIPRTLLLKLTIAVYEKQGNDEAMHLIEQLYDVFHETFKLRKKRRSADLFVNYYAFIVDNRENLIKYYPTAIHDVLEDIIYNYYSEGALDEVIEYTDIDKVQLRTFYHELTGKNIEDYKLEGY